MKWICAALVGLLAVVGTLPFDAAAMPRAPQEAAGSEPSLDALVKCIAERRHVAVVLLVDESASIHRTDPDGNRVGALVSTLQALNSLAAASTKGSPAPQVDVQLAGFDAKYRPEGGWIRLSDDQMPGTLAKARSFLQKDDHKDTDYFNALAGAKQALTEREGEVAGNGGRGLCKAVLWFTDGGYVLGLHRGADAQEYGTSKPYAPGVDLSKRGGPDAALAEGRKALCREGGLADQLRDAGISNLAVVLTADLKPGDPRIDGVDEVDPKAFLQALTTGSGPGYRCGTAGSASSGAYLPVDDVGTLPARFLMIVCRITGCAVVVPEGEPKTFVVDRAFGSALISISGAQGTSVVLTAPSGTVAPIVIGQASASTSLGKTKVRVQPSGPSGSLVTLTFPASGSDHLGTWTLDATGVQFSATVYLTTGVQPTLDGDPVAEVGGTKRLRYTIRDRAGAPVPAADIDGQLALTAKISDPLSGKRRTVPVTGPDSGGRGTITIDVPAGTRSAHLEVVTQLAGTAGGDRPLIPRFTTFQIPVVKDESLPRIITDQLYFSQIRKGHGSSDRPVGRSTIMLQGSRIGPGEACIQGGQVIDAPRRAKGISVSGGCVTVPRSARVELPVEARASDPKSGEAHLGVDVSLSSRVTGAKDTRQVPALLTMDRGLDAGRALWIFVVIMLASVLCPLGVLWLWNWYTGRFHGNFATMWSSLPVRIDGGTVVRDDGEGGSVRFAPDKWPFVTDVNSRLVRIGGDAIEVRPRIRLFALPTAAASSSAGPVVGSAGVQRRWIRRSGYTKGILPHSLFGGWLAALDSAGPPDGDQVVDAAGDVYVIRDDEPGWRARVDEAISDIALLGSSPAAVAAAERLAREAERSVGGGETKGHDGDEGRGEDLQAPNDPDLVSGDSGSDQLDPFEPSVQDMDI